MSNDVKVLKGPGTLASTAYLRLRGEVMTAQLLPGQKLHIRKLCERYGIGHSPIREALNRLLRDGLVTQTDQQGFRVAPVSIAQLEELTRTRCWLNELGLRQSIANGDAAWEEGVVVACHRLLRLPLRAEVDAPRRDVAWEDAHRVFHRSLLAACGSQWLLTFCDQLFDAAERYRHISRIANPTDAPRHEHKEIMEAAVARDADRAADLLNRHFRNTADRAQEKLILVGKEQTNDDMRGGSIGRSEKNSRG
jgi:DNA-binding GntR family transcriptional regulator